MTAMTPVEQAFAPVFGRPCWLVHKVHGSIVTMSFGQPRVQIGEEQTWSLHGWPALRQRYAAVESDWLLTIYLCDWMLKSDDFEMAHNESDDLTMARAFKVLDGQALLEVDSGPPGGATEFRFDLGGVLSCAPAKPGTYSDGPSEMWWLSDTVTNTGLTVRDDGSYGLHPLDSERDERVWSALPS